MADTILDIIDEKKRDPGGRNSIPIDQRPPTYHGGRVNSPPSGSTGSNQMGDNNFNGSNWGGGAGDIAKAIFSGGVLLLGQCMHDEIGMPKGSQPQPDSRRNDGRPADKPLLAK